MRITKHVYMLSGNCYSVLGNVYGIDTPEGWILIDTGNPGEGFDQVGETVREEGMEEKYAMVLLTHGHCDHAGSAKQFKDAGAKIVCGKADAKFMLENGGLPFDVSPFGEEMVYPACQADMEIEEETTFTFAGVTIRAIPLPGHSAGSMGYWVEIDGKKILFSGDTVCGDGNVMELVQLCWRGGPDFDSKAYIDSLMKLYPMQPDILLGGHGVVCMKNAQRVLINAAREGLMQR